MAALEDNDARDCGKIAASINTFVRGLLPTPKPAPQRSLQDFSVKDVWPCFAPTEGGIPADEVTERRAGENIGREMRLQCDP